MVRMFTPVAVSVNHLCWITLIGELVALHRNSSLLAGVYQPRGWNLPAYRTFTTTIFWKAGSGKVSLEAMPRCGLEWPSLLTWVKYFAIETVFFEKYCMISFEPKLISNFTQNVIDQFALIRFDKNLHGRFGWSQTKIKLLKVATTLFME